VAEKIKLVSGSSTRASDYTFAGNSPRIHGDEAQGTAVFGTGDGRRQNLEEAVNMCEFAASNLMSAFHSHQSTKLKIQEVESEIAEQRSARERLETVAQRVDEAENEAAEERQARKQLEAKVRLAKNDCVRLAERLSTMSGSQALPSRTASLEEAMASCDSAVVRIEALLDEERTARKVAETEKQEVFVSKERQTKGLQAEIMKLRADVAHERKLREAVEESLLNSTSSKRSLTPAWGNSLSPQGSLADYPESERLLLYQGLASTGVPSTSTGARTPPRMHSVHENVPDETHSIPSSSDFGTPISSRPSCSRIENCKSSLKCAIQ